MEEHNWRLEWIDGGEASISDDLRQRWDMAFEDHGNIWQCRDFVRAWDNTLSVARKQEPILLLAQDTAVHQVLYPLYATPSRTVSNLCTVVEPMGGVSQCDYQDPLSIGLPMAMVDRVTFWKALSSAVSRRWGWLSELCVYRLSDFSMDQLCLFRLRMSLPSYR